MKLEIPILAHSSYDLSKFDFAFKDIYIVNIQEESFRNYIYSLEPNEEFHGTNYNFVNHIINDIHHEFQKFYAVIKKDFKKDYDYIDIYNVYKLLIIIFPSDIQILYQLSYYETDGIIQAGEMLSFEERITGDYPGKYLYSNDSYLLEINDFIKRVFNLLHQENYIGLAISHYLTSFDASHYHYRFLTLCMVLEASISGTSELTYRLKRNIAVLIGDDESSSNRVFSNIDKIYALRSTIIHGDQYNHKKMLEYLPYLQAITSRTIIELLVHNHEKNKTLNHRITQLGFGDYQNISKDYKKYSLNIINQADTYEELK